MIPSIPSQYPGHITVQEALDDFFEKNQLGPDGGQGDKWVKLRFGRLYIPFPNLPARKRAVMYHDIHHLIAGYPTTWSGEAAVGAWEVSAGCGDYLAAWVFDMGIFALALFIFPRVVFDAFIRGRRSGSLYHHTYSYQEIVQMQVQEVRAKLRLDTPPYPAQPAEIMAFAGWWLASFGLSLLIFVAPVAVPIWCVVHL
jgi:hypothetical protein